MCRLRNIAMRDYQESVTIGQTDTRTHRQTADKVIPMCRYASQETQQKKCTLILIKCTLILIFMLKRQPLKGRKNQCQFFCNVTSGIHWKIFATVFLSFIAGECHGSVNIIFKDTHLLQIIYC